MTDRATIGETVNRLRIALGLTQTEVAERADISQTAVSLLVNGESPGHREALERVTAALRVPESYVLDARSIIAAENPLLRAYTDAHQSTVDVNLALCEIVTELALRAGLRPVRDQLPRLVGDVNDPEEIDEHALVVRRAAKVSDDEPVGNCIRKAENLGCVVLPLDDELGRHVGMSTVVNRRPFIMVARALGPAAPIPGDRQRFTTAHELGHLTLHDDERPPSTPAEARRLERQAHRFAGAFLLPTEPALAEYRALKGRITLRGLADIKSRWGIAIKALVKRYSGLQLIDDDHARSLYKQISSRGWNKSEPVEVGGESAKWLQSALELATPAGEDPVSWVAGSVGLPAELLRPLTVWEDSAPGDVVEVDFSNRRSSSSASSKPTDTATDVIRLR